MGNNTHKELEICELLNQGKRNKEISELVGCSDGLVTYYRKKINDDVPMDSHRRSKLSGSGEGGYGKVSMHIRK